MMDRCYSCNRDVWNDPWDGECTKCEFAGDPDGMGEPEVEATE